MFKTRPVLLPCSVTSSKPCPAVGALKPPGSVTCPALDPPGSVTCPSGGALNPPFPCPLPSRQCSSSTSPGNFSSDSYSNISNIFSQKLRQRTTSSPRVLNPPPSLCPALQVVLSSDEPVFGGYSNVTKDSDGTLTAAAGDYDGRPNSLMVRV